MNWAGDGCRRCGKYPLSILNVSGYCRNCSRRHVTHRKPNGRPPHRVRDIFGRFAPRITLLRAR